MQEIEAIICIKRIYSHVPTGAFTFERKSTGYQIIINGPIAESDRKAIRSIAEQLCLLISEDRNVTVIYKKHN